MFDQSITKVSNSNTLNINAVNGTILKNYKDSFFVRCNIRSSIGEHLLSPECEAYSKGLFKDAVVIQMMICRDMEGVFEVMWKKDFEKLMEAGEDK